MAKVLEEARVVIVGSECPDVVAVCKMTPAATIEEALALAARELGQDLDVLIVPHALLTLPVVQEEPGFAALLIEKPGFSTDVTHRMPNGMT
jgi:hypothetical protein